MRKNELPASGIWLWKYTFELKSLEIDLGIFQTPNFKFEVDFVGSEVNFKSVKIDFVF